MRRFIAASAERNRRHIREVCFQKKRLTPNALTTSEWGRFFKCHISVTRPKTHLPHMQSFFNGAEKQWKLPFEANCRPATPDISVQFQLQSHRYRPLIRGYGERTEDSASPQDRSVQRTLPSAFPAAKNHNGTSPISPIATTFGWRVSSSVSLKTSSAAPDASCGWIPRRLRSPEIFPQAPPLPGLFFKFVPGTIMAQIPASFARLRTPASLRRTLQKKRMGMRNSIYCAEGNPFFI